MASIELPAGSFDLVTAFYSLIHVPKEEHAAVVARMYSWLRPGGYLVLTMGGGDRAGEGTEEAWLGVAPMYWSNWDVTTSRQLVAEAGFEGVEANLETLEEDGGEVTFLWVIARQTGAATPGDLRAKDPKVRGPGGFSGARRVSRAQSAVTPDIEYAAAYAVRTQTPGDQRVRVRGGRERTAANSAPATTTAGQARTSCRGAGA